MKMMFVRMMYSQMVVKKLVKIDSPDTLASLSVNNVTSICNVIRRPGGLVNRRRLDRWFRVPY